MAGTLVATSMGSVPIEAIGVGDRVLTLGEAGPEAVGAELGDWQLVEVLVPDSSEEGSYVELKLLRSPAWVELAGAVLGAEVEIQLEGMGLSGPGLVTSLGPAPPIGAGRGQVVLGTMTRIHADVRALRFEESETPLQVTSGHLLFSSDRQAWVPVRELRVGEQLQARAGTARVESVTPIPGRHRVYNLEVQTDHRYLTSELGVLSHNDCPEGAARGGPNIVQHPSQRAARRAADREAGMGRHGGRETLPDQPLHPGSQSPQGPRGTRTETRSTDTDRTVHHDPYGHRDGNIPPHYGVDGPGIDGTTHHTYPTTHDPSTNR